MFSGVGYENRQISVMEDGMEMTEQIDEWKCKINGVNEWIGELKSSQFSIKLPLEIFHWLWKIRY